MIHYTTDKYLEFQQAFALSSAKCDSQIAHLLETIPIVEILLLTKTDIAPAYVSNKIVYYFRHYGIEHVSGISQNLTGQASCKEI